MIKYIVCPGCKQDHPIKGNAKNRGDLQMQKGNEFKFNCHHCGKIANTHVNDVKAKPNKIIIVAATLVAVIGGVFLLLFIGYLGGFAFLIPMAAWKQQELSVSAFNRYKIKR
ncbi:MAG: hypothetical protein ABJM06_06565 [Gilvibacter sp.]